MFCYFYDLLEQNCNCHIYTHLNKLFDYRQSRKNGLSSFVYRNEASLKHFICGFPWIEICTARNPPLNKKRYNAFHDFRSFNESWGHHSKNIGGLFLGYGLGQREAPKLPVYAEAVGWHARPLQGTAMLYPGGFTMVPPMLYRGGSAWGVPKGWGL